MKFCTSLILIFTLFLFSCEKVESYDNYVILVSLDGCRWDYPDKYDTPNLAAMASEGVKAEHLVSSFPTKTFPNHYSIATGLYPDNHGLIDNSFLAPDLGLQYSMGNRAMVENPDFYGGEPIWNTAEKQGMISASFFWVGSEAPVQGIQPTYWKQYDGSIAYEARIDTIIHWLELPLHKRPRLLLLYFDQPDAIGHDYGPDHVETGNVVTEMDRLVGELRNKIGELPYGDRVNLIVTSDHGMAAISPERYVNINDHIAPDWIAMVAGGSPVYLIDAVDGFEDSVVNNLNYVEGVSAWRKEDVPSHMNYGSNSRIPDIVVAADSSWSLGWKPDPSGYTGGAHGYDNQNSDMYSIFYAVGPSFKKGYLHTPFENVDIYPLIAHILRLEPTATDGNLDDVAGLLK